jgi:hypothetical protein
MIAGPMPLDLSDPSLPALREHLSPYLHGALERAATEAVRLFAEEVALEHLLGALLADEDSALHRLVLHAFADPETVALDLLALAPGILVVASDATLPFSPGGVAAVEAARAGARAAGRSQVGAAGLLVGALAALPDELAARLREGGLDGGRLEEAAREEGSAGQLEAGASLFHPFLLEARQALSRAARAAVRAREASIGPARIALESLATADLGPRIGLPAARAALLLQGATADPTPPPERRLRPTRELASFLQALPPAGGSLDVLAALHREPRSELTLAFTRQKVTPELLAHARGSFLDPPG